MPKARPTTRDLAEQAQRSKDAAISHRAQMAMDYKTVFASAPGQRVLADLIRCCGVLLASPDQYHEGRRSIGLALIEAINLDPAALNSFAITSEVGDLYERNTDTANR